MLAIDVMEEMAWDDYLAKVGENAYTLNTKGQVQEGVFLRKSNGKNSSFPTMAVLLFSFQSATPCRHSMVTG